MRSTRQTRAQASCGNEGIEREGFGLRLFFVELRGVSWHMTFLGIFWYDCRSVQAKIPITVCVRLRVKIGRLLLQGYQFADSWAVWSMLCSDGWLEMFWVLGGVLGAKLREAFSAVGSVWSRYARSTTGQKRDTCKRKLTQLLRGKALPSTEDLQQVLTRMSGLRMKLDLDDSGLYNPLVTFVLRHDQHTDISKHVQLLLSHADKVRVETRGWGGGPAARLGRLTKGVPFGCSCFHQLHPLSPLRGARIHSPRGGCRLASFQRRLGYAALL